MIGGSIVGLGDERLELYRDHATSPFWSVVDSTSGFDGGFERACHCHERPSGYCDMCGGGWSAARESGCLALRSDSTRCRQWTPDRDPFCPFHMERAVTWFLGRLTDEAVTAQRARLRSIFGDPEALLVEAQQIIGSARLGGSRVYFYELAGQGLVKIGTSTQVNHRTAQFRSGKGCTFPPNCDPSAGHLLGHIAGDRLIERALHMKYRGLRVVGEWFRLTDALADEIEHLLSKEAAPVAQPA